jgi:hypothetical protein
MNSPPVVELIPSKAKAWIGLLTASLTVVVPWILEVSTAMPQPWPTVIAAVIGILGVFGIYQAPYKPEGENAVLVPEDVVHAPVLPPATPSNPVRPSTWNDPYA